MVDNLNYLLVGIAILIIRYLLDLIIELLELKSVSQSLPSEFENFFTQDKYIKYQSYRRENTRLYLLKGFVFTGVCVTFILFKGLGILDNWVRSFFSGELLRGLVFTGILFFSLEIIFLPFSVYRTFVIEAKYGFNRTKPRTFLLDLLKSWFLTLVISGLILAGLIWLFQSMGRRAWVYCWLGVGIFQLFLEILSPVLILPLFNKFIPIEEGELKKAIEDYAQKVKLKLKGIFKIDASRRTSKANAFFTGLGRYKRIAFFDNLIDRLTIPEIISVLAHEVAHFKKKHILKRSILYLISWAVSLWLFGFFITNREIFNAFGIKEVSVYAGLVLFSIFYIPLGIVFSLLMNFISRRQELEADRFAALTTSGQDYILALKKLYAENFSSLKPHPLKVFFYFNHPPVLKRIEFVKTLACSF